MKIENKNFPKLLKEIPDVPSFLNYRGSFEKDIFADTLAVVGSRRITSYGRRVVEEVVTRVAREGVTIVSGFMYGVDAAAHRAALSVGGKTIAVMPCGVDVVHPAHQEDLYKEIKKKGLIVSEFEDGYPPDKWTYPKRNRIVVGISKATLVVEAGERSGSIISANLAIKYKRKLFAVPGQIFSPTSEGTNRLIKDGLAESISSPEDILSFFEKTGENKISRAKKDFTEEESKVVELLKIEPLDTDTLAKNANISAQKANVILSMLSVKGVVKKEGRKYRI